MKTLEDIKREAWQCLVNADSVGKNTVDLIIDHLHSQGLLMVWNTDMDSAPRDGTDFLATDGFFTKVCAYDRGDLLGWPHVVKPTAWMPLPEGGE